jgi:predicted TIM-barrel fold metal-dependent hydrolase
VPWLDEAMCLVGKHDNVYVDTSYWATVEEPEIILRHLLRCPRFGCTYDRILWGTDFPMTTPAVSLELFRETLPALADRLELEPIPADGLDLVLGGNAARIYGLE